MAVVVASMLVPHFLSAVLSAFTDDAMDRVIMVIMMRQYRVVLWFIVGFTRVMSCYL